MVAAAKSRVFIVDDERIISNTLAAILKQHGFDATAFDRPLEALAAAESMRPDLVITDVAMPHMDGVQLGIELKKIVPGCTVLLFSGQAGTADLLTKARSQGHDFVMLTKPLHPSDLLAAIAKTTA